MKNHPRSNWFYLWAFLASVFILELGYDISAGEDAVSILTTALFFLCFVFSAYRCWGINE